MRRLSSKSTWFHKKGFWLIWFPITGLITAGWTVGVVKGGISAFTLLIPVGAAALGYTVIE